MALLWAERYGGYYDTSTHDSPSAGSLSSIDTTGARDGGRCLVLGNGGFFTRELLATQTGTGIVGVVFKVTGAYNSDAGHALLKIIDSDTTTSQLTISFESTGTTSRIVVRRGTQSGTILATGSIVLNPDTWYVVEFKFTIHDSTGAIQVKTNGIDDIHSGGGMITGLDTRNGANGDWKHIQIVDGSNGSGSRWETMWALNTSGSFNNDFIGDQTAVCLMPDADDSVQFTRSGGATNAAAVDDIPRNADTDYVESSTTGHKDTYGVANIPGALSGKLISGWRHVIAARQTDTGSGELRPIVKTDLGTQINGSTIVMGQSANYTTLQFSMIGDVNPDTAARYTESEINGIKIGHEKVV